MYYLQIFEEGWARLLYHNETDERPFALGPDWPMFAADDIRFAAHEAEVWLDANRPQNADWRAYVSMAHHSNGQTRTLCFARVDRGGDLYPSVAEALKNLFPVAEVDMPIGLYR